MPKKTDICIIGGGIAGLTATTYALENGYDVVLFEHNSLGGKAFNGGDLYLNIFFKEIKLNKLHNKNHLNKLFRESEANKHLVLDAHFPFLKNGNNLTIVRSKATIINPNLVESKNIQYNCKQIIIATGSKHFIPKIKGIENSIDKGYSLFSTQLSKIKKDSKKIAIIGAGRVAFELAMILIEFQIETHIFARNDILTHLDKEVKDIFVKNIKNKYLHIHLNTSYQEIKDNTIYFNDTSITFDNILLASGFRTENTVFKNLNVDYSYDGILVNSFMQTSISNIYAIGDANIHQKFSKTAISEAITAIDHIKGVRTQYKDNFFYHILGNFEYAYLGLNEETLKKDNVDYLKIAINEEQIVNNYDKIKFVKVLVDKITRKILGLFVVAKDASVVMNSLLLLLEETLENIINSRLSLFTDTHYVVSLINNQLKKIDENIINTYFEPFYQIKVDENKNILGAESLARFKYNDNYLSPLPFITNFEKNGLIIDLDLKTIESACIFLNELKAKNLIDDSFYISVNISSLSIDKLDYQTIEQYLNKYEIEPHRLIFEITERKTYEEESYVNKLNKFKSLGFHLSMDDFSVGNSSLNLFYNVDFNEVKIDMDLLPDNKDDEIKISIYKNIITMLRRKDTIISAEGVENDFHFNFVKSLDINNYQGYYFSKPLAKKDLIKLLKTHTSK